jgi:phosphonatase-like hydrolase
MIHQLMERMGVMDARRVAKIGDTARDVEMGVNAGCGLVIGVLSGADKADTLFKAGAHIVADCITDIPIPARGPLRSGKLMFAPDMVKYSQDPAKLLQNMDLMVCDMAGTTVEEHGIVYKTLQSAMQKHGLSVSDAEIDPWHGAKKEAVIQHFAQKAGKSATEVDALVKECAATFEGSIMDAYFSPSSKVSLIDANLISYLKSLRHAGVKIGLDTGYPVKIQKGLVEKLGFEAEVDGYISSYEVKDGRPYPYMIHQLMERMGVMDARRVAKIGDTARDVEMGVNAGCGLVIGVLSGADKADTLFKAGAHIVADCITDIPIPVRAAC